MLRYKDWLDTKRMADNNKNSSKGNANIAKPVKNYKIRPSAEIFKFEPRPVNETDGLDKYVLHTGKKRKAPVPFNFLKRKSQIDKKKKEIKKGESRRKTEFDHQNN